MRNKIDKQNLKLYLNDYVTTLLSTLYLKKYINFSQDDPRIHGSSLYILFMEKIMCLQSLTTIIHRESHKQWHMALSYTL
jgi:hypothetical protein